MQIEYTPAQLNAINIKGKSLLVSAAAGSGKTSTLTDRIIKLITDSENPLDISRLLVVTFTRAAVAELKQRISVKLTDALMQSPDNKLLNRQLSKLGNAQICTIDSFCVNIVRRYFEKLGVNPNVRIGDDAEIKIINQTVMRDTVDRLYDEYYDIDFDFIEFSDNFVTDTDDSFIKTMILIYEKLQTLPSGIDIIKNTIDTIRQEDYFYIVIDDLKSNFKYFLAIYEEALKYFENNTVFAKYINSFESNYNFILNILKLNDWEEIRFEINNFINPRLSSVKAENKTEESIFYCDKRNDFKNYINKIKKGYFTYTKEQNDEFFQNNKEICKNIYSFLKIYDDELKKEKEQLNILSFSDFEILTHRLLYDENGNKTSAAHEISSNYDGIFIDEYQDTNELQDNIFKAVSNENNLFIVGDVKQSIYNFRGASPWIFAKYKDKYPVYDKNNNQNGKEENTNTILMSENFRCDKPIINFINGIFNVLFKNSNGKLSYNEEDALVYAKKDLGHIQSDVEIYLIANDANLTENTAEDENIETEDETEPEDISNTQKEAAFVAEKIQYLIDYEGYKLSDIVILIRKTKNIDVIFEEALSKINIPYYNESKKDFFGNAEVLLILCLLNCIDNPSRDIYLAGVLKSPLFGFTLDDLINIKIDCPGISLYDSLIKYTEINNYEKGLYFFDKLNKYRKYASGESVDRLIWYIYRDSGIFNIINNNTNNNIRHSNLLILYEYAKKFESNSFKGLYSFILYINDIIEGKHEVDNAKIINKENDFVRIMTIHKAKGLEFPVCFVCGCGNNFNFSDNREDFIYTLKENKFYCGTKIKDKTGYAKYNTLIHKAACSQNEKNIIDEEMRLLYVALTRAKKRLIITSVLKNPQDLICECKNESRYLNKYIINSNPSYIKWILYIYANGNNDCCKIYTINDIELNAKIKNISLPEKNSDNILKTDNIKKIIYDKLSFIYPNKHLSKLPAKISVSQLYPTVLDEDDSIPYSNDKLLKTKEPEFLNNTSKATAAQRGTATHVFMQFCDFNNIEKYGINEEIARLVANSFITKTQAELIYKNYLEVFFKSALYNEIKLSNKIWREIRFNIKLPASQFTGEADKIILLQKEKILVQGVIDCLFIDSAGNLILVDYKTDYIDNETRKDEKAADNFLIERHKTQINYYKTASNRIIGKPVDYTYIYSFCLGRKIEL